MIYATKYICNAIEAFYAIQTFYCRRINKPTTLASEENPNDLAYVMLLGHDVDVKQIMLAV